MVARGRRPIARGAPGLVTWYVELMMMMRSVFTCSSYLGLLSRLCWVRTRETGPVIAYKS